MAAADADVGAAGWKTHTCSHFGAHIITPLNEPVCADATASTLTTLALDPPERADAAASLLTPRAHKVVAYPPCPGSWPSHSRWCPRTPPRG